MNRTSPPPLPQRGKNKTNRSHSLPPKERTRKDKKQSPRKHERSKGWNELSHKMVQLWISFIRPNIEEVDSGVRFSEVQKAENLWGLL